MIPIRTVKALTGLTATVADVQWPLYTGQRRTVTLDGHTRTPLSVIGTEAGLEIKRNGKLVVLPMAELLKLLDEHAPELKPSATPTQRPRLNPVPIV